MYLLYRRAYETLAHETERVLYDRTLPDEDGTSTGGLARVVAAEEAFRRGVIFTNDGDWDGALGEFQTATEHNPAEGAYVAYLAWAAFCAEPDRHDVCQRALQELEAAVDASPMLEDAYVFAGLIRDKLGDTEGAVESLERAVNVNPDSVRALRALRTLRPPVQTKSGFWARLGLD